MKKQKLYFQRHYDQWKGLDVAIEEEIDGHGLYIQVPDMDMTNGSVTSISAEFEGIGSRACTVYDESKRIIRVEMPLTILANDGLYEVSFTMAYNSKGVEGRIEKTAIQTFTILDTIEIPEEEILADDRYNILTDLLSKVQDEEIDVSIFAKKEEVIKLIEDALNNVDMENIISELEKRGLYITPEQLTQRLNNVLSGYITKFDSAQFAKTSDLSAYTKTVDLSKVLGLSNYTKRTELDGYVKKETGKSLTSNDFTDALKNKLENISEDGNYDDTELRNLIGKKADTSTVIDLVNSINSINRDDYYEKTIIDDYVEDITNTHNEDISNIEEELLTFLKKEDYQYSDGINSDDITFNEKTLTEILTELFYKEIEIKKFNSTLVSHLYELNVDKINSITLNWELNKNPISQSINNYNGTLSVNDRSIIINNQISKDTDFILTVVDEKGIEKTSTISIKFIHPSYYGTYTDTLDINTVLYGDKIIMDNKNQTINMSYNNKKIFFAFPKYFGELIDIKDNNGLSYFDDFIYDGDNFGMNGTSYNVYKLDMRATVENISYSLIFEKEEE